MTSLIARYFLRLVRGEGEIIEEMVTKEKHKDINKVKHPVKLPPVCIHDLMSQIIIYTV